GAGFASRRCIPELHGAVLTPGGQPPTVRAERHTRDGVLVAAQDEGLIPGGHVPDLHDIVAGRGRESPAVRAKRQTQDSLRMVKRQGLPPCFSVPNLYHPIAAS